MKCTDIQLNKEFGELNSQTQSVYNSLVEDTTAKDNTGAKSIFGDIEAAWSDVTGFAQKHEKALIIAGAAIALIAVGIATCGVGDAVLAPALAAALGMGAIGAGTSLAGEEISDYMDDGKIDNTDQSYLGTAAGGFITGALIPGGGTEAVGLKGIATQAAKNGLAGMVGNTVQQQISTGKVDEKEVLETGVVSGVLTGAACGIPAVADNLNNLQGGLNSSFANNIDDVLAKQGISMDEFNTLRLTDTSTLTSAEKATLKAVRESIPMPDTNTVMQKVIPSSDIENYLDGSYTQVGGYVTRTEDVTQLSTYDDIYNSLRLDYPKSAFNPLADDSVGVIRYTSDEASKFSIPYGTEMGGTEVSAQPFTGNGFTKATNGQIIPEFKCDGYLKVSNSAQLIEIQKDGTQTLKAVYDVDFGKFVSIE